MRFSTKAIHDSQPSDPATGALITPIYQTSTYQQQEPGVNQGFEYSRTNNPTRQTLERVLASLEGVEHAAVYASGLAAEQAVLDALLKPGDQIVIPPDVYGGTFRLLHTVYKPKGYRIATVDLNDVTAVESALDGDTKLVWLESPTNPRLLIYDIAAVARVAHEHGALLVVDNTFATPVFQRPFELGADVVIHSVTKYIAGHSDVIQGAALARDPAVFEPIKYMQNAAGGVPSAFDCWLTLRGIQTLALRVRQHAANAEGIARVLQSHPAIGRVYHPGLASHPGHEVARRQMSGFGGMVSIELNATLEQVRRFVSSRRYFTLAESLGGVKALICQPATMTHASIPPDERRKLGLSDSLVRLSPGLEDVEDLIEDLTEGLNALLEPTGATDRREGQVERVRG